MSETTDVQGDVQRLAKFLMLTVMSICGIIGGVISLGFLTSARSGHADETVADVAAEQASLRTDDSATNTVLEERRLLGAEVAQARATQTSQPASQFADPTSDAVPVSSRSAN